MKTKQVMVQLDNGKIIISDTDRGNPAVFDFGSSHRDIATHIKDRVANTEAERVRIYYYQDSIRNVNGVDLSEEINIKEFDASDFEARSFSSLGPKFRYAVFDGNQNHGRELPEYVTNDIDDAKKHAEKLNKHSAIGNYFACYWNARESAREFVRDLQRL